MIFGKISLRTLTGLIVSVGFIAFSALVSISAELNTDDPKYLYLACKEGEMSACDEFVADGSHDPVLRREVLEMNCSVGIPNHCTGLAHLYGVGAGVPKDGARARELYDRACVIGDHQGCYYLARTLESGEGGLKDERLALHYYNRGCQLGDELQCISARRLTDIMERQTGAPSGGASTAQQSVPPCGQEYWIEPATMPCGSEWKPRGEWPTAYWCYTDYNMQIHGSLGVTYCTDGAGVWERSGLFDRCDGVKGWCE